MRTRTWALLSEERSKLTNTVHSGIHTLYRRRVVVGASLRAWRLLGKAVPTTLFQHQLRWSAPISRNALAVIERSCRTAVIWKCGFVLRLTLESAESLATRLRFGDTRQICHFLMIKKVRFPICGR